MKTTKNWNGIETKMKMSTLVKVYGEWVRETRTVERRTVNEVRDDLARRFGGCRTKSEMLAILNAE